MLSNVVLFQSKVDLFSTHVFTADIWRGKFRLQRVITDPYFDIVKPLEIFAQSCRNDRKI